MTKQPDTGGAAFPGAVFDARLRGMTLLDYFAAAATDSDVRHAMAARALKTGDKTDPAYARYYHAAAMLTERRRRESEEAESDEER